MKPSINGKFYSEKVWMQDGDRTEVWEWREDTGGKLFDVHTNRGCVASGLTRERAADLAAMFFDDFGVDLVRIVPANGGGKWVLLETTSREPT